MTAAIVASTFTCIKYEIHGPDYFGAYCTAPRDGTSRLMSLNAKHVRRRRRIDCGHAIETSRDKFVISTKTSTAASVLIQG